MDNFVLYLNLFIGFIVVVGLFLFFSRTYNWFDEGGLIYEWWHSKNKNEKKKISRVKNTSLDDDDFE